MKKIIFFLFFNIFFIQAGICATNTQSWKKKEKTFMKNDSAWIDIEKKKKSVFFRHDKVFFKKDIGWKSQDKGWHKKDGEWIRLEKIPIDYQ